MLGDRVPRLRLLSNGHNPIERANRLRMAVSGLSAYGSFRPIAVVSPAGHSGPMEFAIEAQERLDVGLEGSVG